MEGGNGVREANVVTLCTKCETSYYAALNDKNSFELAKLLVEHGADVNAKDNEGKTILNYAINQEQIQWLKNHGAENHYTKNRWSLFKLLKIIFGW